jgi:hypothetical protein
MFSLHNVARIEKLNLLNYKETNVYFMVTEPPMLYFFNKNIMSFKVYYFH